MPSSQPITETKFFYELTPDRILTAIEDSMQVRLTGRTFAHNSMENRVYELWIDHEGTEHPHFNDPKKHPSLIAKFYRPARWSKEQILEEHSFIKELVEDEIPVIAPLTFADGETLHQLEDCGIYYTVFPKARGRHASEPTDEMYRIVGRLIARMHNVGASRPMTHRLALTPESYGQANSAYLLDNSKIPLTYETRFRRVCEELDKLLTPMFASRKLQRVHGDLHLGNILWNGDLPTIVDFDDCLSCAPVQDMWLFLPGRDESAQRYLTVLLDAYSSMRDFDDSSLELIEGLRALRFIHFSAWIARRWDDPSFQRNFPHFATDQYWANIINDLSEQVSLLQQRGTWQRYPH